MKRRTIVQAGLCAGLSLIGATRLAPNAWAQEKWPSKRVTIYVPSAAGGNLDACTRLIAAVLKDIYGQPFIVENHGGASGTIGSNIVAKEPPDGYKLLMAGNTSLSAAPVLIKNVPYDPIEDFAPIARVGRFSSVLITTPDQPFKSMQGLVAYAKANPEKLNFGYANSAGQIVGEALKKRTGINLTSVAYSTSGAAIVDLLGGRIQLVFSDILSGGPPIQAGKVVPLATSFLERSSLLPDVPTLNETVMPGFEVVPWLGLYAPAGIPNHIVQILSDNLRTMLTRSDIVARIATMGIEPYYAPSEETAAFLKADLRKWQELAREAGIEPQ